MCLHKSNYSCLIWEIKGIFLFMYYCLLKCFFTHKLLSKCVNMPYWGHFLIVLSLWEPFTCSLARWTDSLDCSRSGRRPVDALSLTCQACIDTGVKTPIYHLTNFISKQIPNVPLTSPPSFTCFLIPRKSNLDPVHGSQLNFHPVFLVCGSISAFFIPGWWSNI